MKTERTDAIGAIKPEKVDLAKNGKVDLHQLHRLDKRKVSLRIDERTVIRVDKKNATPEYAEAYRRKMNRTIL